MGKRIVEGYVPGLGYIEIDFDELSPGVMFRIFDDGIPYIDEYGNTEWIVKSVPKKNSDGLLYVETEEYTQ
jgi:hypothetical protein